MRCLTLVLTVGIILAGSLRADAKDPSHVHRDFVIDATIVSKIPGGSIEAYDSHGSGMAANGATTGLGVRVGKRRFMVEFQPYIDKNRLMLSVKADPESDDLKFDPFDMSSLRPIAIDLGKDEDGRAYQANVSPRVRVTDNTPKAFDAAAMRLHHWRFPNCSILLNDSTYVGRIHCFSSPVAFLEISDTAKIEFSLKEVVGWKPWGVLRDGTMAIRHPEEGTTVEIAGVRNGRDGIELPGGPYTVWVNWAEPSYTDQNVREMLLATREQIVSGELRARKGALAHIEKQLTREPGPWTVSSGLRGYRSDEKVTGK